MYRDVDGLLISETSNWPGSHGDSCANTCRSEVLNPKNTHIATKFVTSSGFVRHTNLPEDWKEGDFSDDQCIPLYLAGTISVKRLVRSRLPIKAGNGGIHNPIALAVIWDSVFILNLLLLAQLFLLTKVPYRWSDADGLKFWQRFEKTEGSSADWLNWFTICVALKRCSKLYFKPPIEQVAHKVYDYFQNEPNNVQTLLDYEEAFKLWE